MKQILDFLISIYKKHGTLFQGKLFNTVILLYKYGRVEKDKRSLVRYIADTFPKVKVYGSKNKSKAIQKLLGNVCFDLSDCEHFVYSIDVYKSTRLHGKILGNCTVDYRKVIFQSLSDLRIDSDSDFARQNNLMIDAIIDYLERLRQEVEKSYIANKGNICMYLERFRTEKAASLEEAMQRILIINQLQWQTGHILVGLGRLDLALDSFLTPDVPESYIEELVSEFCLHLHKYYYFKSNALMGDTGQIIILGGKNPDGTYFCNTLTGLFMRVIASLGIPDPKILLRVSKAMPEPLWERLAIGMTSNVGSPLISNDDKVIDGLLDFGYEPEDAYNYTTSACWEPIPGEAFEQNNILSLNYLKPFDIISRQGNLDSITSFDILLNRYFDALKIYVADITEYLSSIRWEQDPLYSALNDSCRSKELDAAFGGSKYNNYGILTVALSNAINALHNIDTFVFQKGAYTYRELDDMRRKNYKGHEIARMQLKNNEKVFGKDDPETISLVNLIMNKTEECMASYVNPLGGKLKFGLSSPHYIMDSTNFPASFDGRLANEPFGMHISASNGVPYTELMNFASQLDYSSRKINGNVVDFMVSPSFVTGNLKKFAEFLRVSVENGVYQMQANVIDSKTLILAKADPDKYPNLIVRVWGFNAYFRELPVEYQDYLIERAKQNERIA